MEKQLLKSCLCSKTTIANIANLCVFNAGPAVLEARSFVTMDSLELMNRNWDDSCSTGSSYRMAYFEEEPIKKENKINERLAIKKYYIIPNPIDRNQIGIINISELGNGFVEIYSVEGKQVLKQNIEFGSNKIFMKNLPSGMYYYKIWLNGMLNNTSKLIIISR